MPYFNAPTLFLQLLVSPLKSSQIYDSLLGHSKYLADVRATPSPHSSILDWKNEWNILNPMPSPFIFLSSESQYKHNFGEGARVGKGQVGGGVGDNIIIIVLMTDDNQNLVHHYLRWNMTILSSYKSLRSSCCPFLMTSGCFLTSSHPTCEKNKPLLALCGSPSVSEHLWWTRWSLAHSKMSFCPAMQLKIISNNLRGHLAL